MQSISRIKGVLAVTRVGRLAAAALLLGIGGASALAAPIYGVSLYQSVDAGAAVDFVNISQQAVTTGTITRAVSDNARGGTQTAFASAYASIGALGGKVNASTAGALLAHGQGFNDLSWYTDFLVTGTPGSTVSYQFGALLDGVVVGSGVGYSGHAHATTFVGSDILGDFKFDVLVNPGPFSVFATKNYTFNVGDVVRLNGRMTVGGNADIDAVINVDALSTSKLFVDVLTPGGGYLTDAGVTFATLLGTQNPPVQIAEPVAPTVWAMGLLCMAVALRRDARRPRKQKFIVQ